MNLSDWVLLGVVVVVLLGWALWVQASRVDRLHRTVLRSRATLETQLVRRATAATELAASGALDPAEAIVVTDVALRAIDAAPAGLVRDGLEGAPGSDPLGEGAAVDDAPDRGLVESELSRTLRTVLGEPEDRAALAADPRATEVLGHLQRSWYRLQVARRFHNAHVQRVREVRARWVVRTFHLAGRAPLPEPFDMDDGLPDD
ncbi:hypothetical protein [Georgenia ruanii]|uniref:NUDIX hydrolase n=1 Tax=Georgenia ruanii TaxID=348442 RepID=A0A7J9UWN9_9MICO|nr:hypothetical protein [Georgenia ruanii]MPV88773.1 hypothetical protein [Georgenia ruanii]